MSDAPYQVIAAEIRRRIEAGELAPGDRVPSTRALVHEFGVAMAIPAEAATLRSDEAGTVDRQFLLRLANEETVRARAVVIASGARYRRLDVRNLEEFECTSVHYWASPLEQRLCSGQEVVLVGAGNSAGQAVVALASYVRKIWLLVRGSSLS